LSKTVNIDTGESGRLLEFKTVHGEIKKICMKNKDLFAGLSQTILKDLAAAGLHINIEAPTRKILVYLNNYVPARSLKTTKKSGWCAHGFLTESGIIAPDECEEDILLDTACGSTHAAINGSTREWTENIGNAKVIQGSFSPFLLPLRPICCTCSTVRTSEYNWLARVLPEKRRPSTLQPPSTVSAPT
jgi:hypothetical protein